MDGYEGLADRLEQRSSRLVLLAFSLLVLLIAFGYVFRFHVGYNLPDGREPLGVGVQLLHHVPLAREETDAILVGAVVIEILQVGVKTRSGIWLEMTSDTLFYL